MVACQGTAFYFFVMAGQRRDALLGAIPQPSTGDNVIELYR